MYYGGTCHVCVLTADLSFAFKITIQWFYYVWEAQCTLRITALTVRAHNEFPEKLQINLSTSLLSKIILKHALRDLTLWVWSFVCFYSLDNELVQIFILLKDHKNLALTTYEDFPKIFFTSMTLLTKKLPFKKTPVCNLFPHTAILGRQQSLHHLSTGTLGFTSVGNRGKQLLLWMMKL